MKVFFTYQGKADKHFLEFDVSSSITVSELIDFESIKTVSYTHLRAHETPEHLVCRLLLEKKKTLISFTITHLSHM